MAPAPERRLHASRAHTASSGAPVVLADSELGGLGNQGVCISIGVGTDEDLWQGCR